MYVSPKTKTEKQHNKETLSLIEAIRAKRIAEAAAGMHGFQDQSKRVVNFFSFFDQIMETKNTVTGKSNYSVWQGCRVQLKRYHADEGLTFDEVTPDWLNGARSFFDTQAETKSANKISKATASTYFNKVRAVACGIPRTCRLIKMWKAILSAKCCRMR